MLIKGVEVQKYISIRIDWDWPTLNFDQFDPKQQRINQYIDRTVQLYKTVNYVNYRPGPCWNAYIIFESENLPDLLNLAADIITYMKRFPQLKFL